jgi:hypothetical protein
LFLIIGSQMAIKCSFRTFNGCVVFYIVLSVLRFAGSIHPRGGSREGGGAPGEIGKNMIYLRKIVIFTRNTQYFPLLPPLGAIFLNAPPLAWNPGSTPDIPLISSHFSTGHRVSQIKYKTLMFKVPCFVCPSLCGF